MTRPPRPWPAVAFSLAILSPLAAAPGLGAWGIRLPLLAAAAAVLALDLARGSAPRPGPLGLAALVFAGVQAVALAAAGSPQEGFPPLLVLFAAVLLFLHARSGQLPAGFVRSTVPVFLSGAGVVLSAVGLAQAVAGTEAISTLGNRNYAGTLAGMLLPASGAWAAGPGPRRVRALHAGALLSLFAYLVVTDSRAGLVAAAAGTVVAAAALFRRFREKAVGAAAVSLLLLALVPIGVRGGAPVSPERLRTASVRWEIWKGAGRMVLDRPLLGVGVGRFSAAYPPYRSFEEARLSHAHDTRSEFREVEDAHSSLAHLASESGLPGLAAFLAVVVLAARAALRRIRAAGEPAEEIRRAALGAGAAAYLAGGLFNTLTLQAPHTALFWAFLGLLEAPEGPAPRAPGKRETLYWAGAAVSLIGVLGGLDRARLEFAFAGAMSFSDPGLRLAALESAGASRKGMARVHEARASALLALRRPEDARTAVRQVLETRPHAAVAMNTDALAALQLGRPREAEEILRRALASAPHCWLTHLNLGSIEYERRNFAEAERHYAQAARLAERMARLPYRVAETFLARDDLPGALPPLRRARELGFDVAAALRRDHPARASDPRLAEFFEVTPPAAPRSHP